MSAEIVLAENKQYVSVKGEITFTNAKALCEKGLLQMQEMQEMQQIIFDFSAVIQSSSVALALLTAWTRAAKKQNKQIRFIHMPQSLLEVARLSNLDRVLTLEAESTHG